MLKKVGIFLLFLVSLHAAAQLPVPDYSAGPDTNLTTIRICRGNTLLFQNLTLTNVDSVYWNFPGGTPANASTNTQAVSWAGNGTRNCSLTIFDSLGVGTTRNFNVVVSSTKPAVSIPATLPDVCSSDPPFVPFSANPPGGFFIGASVSNNLITPSLANMGPGNSVGYYVIGANGCSSDTVYTTYTLLPGPTAFLLEPSNFSNCNGFSAATPTFTIYPTDFSTVPAPDSIVSYDLFWGDGTPAYSGTAPPDSLVHTYPNQGTYSITYVVTSSNGCTDTAVYQVANTTNPSSLTVINPGGTNGCAPVTVTFPLSTTNTDPSITYSISFGDGKPPITFGHPPPPSITYTFDTTSCLFPGNFFNIRATATNACVSTVSTVQGPFVTQPAVALFTPPNPGGCVGVPTIFSNMSIPGYNNACNRLSTFTWDYGDGSPPVTMVSSTPQPPPGNHIYTAPGRYLVTLIVASGGNLCPGDTFQDSVCIGFGPTTNISVPPTVSCVPVTVTPTNTSTLNTYCDTATTLWSVTPATGWSLINNTTLTDLEPQFRFTQPGNYTLRCITSNHCGSDTTFSTVVASAPPSLSFPSIANFCDTASLDFRPGSVFAPTINTNNSPITNFTWTITAPNYTITAGSLSDTGFAATFAPGNYTVILSATNACGTTVDSATFNVAFLTNGGFTLNQTAGCSPLNLTATSTSSPFVNHQWFVNNVLYSTALDTSIILTNSSTTQDSVYQIRLLVFSGPNCADTITQNVTVFARPHVNFSANPVCVGTNTAFFDSTSTIAAAPVASRLWNFGDGNTSTSQNPLHIYQSPGVYNATLTVTDTRGCVATLTRQVVVGANPNPNFTINYAVQPDSACIGDTIFFNNTSNAPPFGFGLASFEWDVLNDGTIDATTTNHFHVFNSPGTFNVRLRVTDSLGCTAFIVRQVYISQPPQAAFSLSQRVGCGPLTVTATNQTTGYATQYNWTFYTRNANGTNNVLYTSSNSSPNPIPPLNAPGLTNANVIARLIASNACYADTSFDTVTVFPLPVPIFQLSQDSGCSPFTVSIQTDGFVTGQPDSIIFDFGDGTPQQTLLPTINLLPNGDTLYTWNPLSHTFVYNGLAADTNFTIVLRAINACGDSTFSRNITVRSRSVQSFFQTNNLIGCAPYTFNVTDGSYAATNVSYCFDFDTLTNTCNGAVLSAPNGSHIFTAFGNYVVAQFVNNDCGFDTSWVTVQVRPTPTPDFIIPASLCVETPFTVTNTSTISLGFITGYNWDFGDGTTSTLTNPTHTYLTPGTYTVCLTAASATNCDSSICKTIVVRNRPLADFDFVIDDLCINEQPVSFVNNSLDSLTSIAGYAWDFDDGNLSTAVNPFHTYALPGTYNVRLVVTNSSGCSDSITKQVNIREKPTTAFSYLVVSGDSCGVPQEVQFTNNSNGAAAYFWDFDSQNPGQQTSTLTHPTHIFTAPGTYQIRLIAQNGLGCSDTLIVPYTIHPIPAPDFAASPFEGCEPLEVAFTNLTSLPPGFTDRLYYRWYFGDGGTSNQINPTHTFQNPGVYWVALAVTSEFGCTDSLYLPNYIEVWERPEPSYTSQIVEFGIYDFTSSVVNGLPPYTYRWDFGDGNTSNQPNPRHTFNIQAVDIALGYNVCLTVTDANNCDETICELLDVGLFTLYIPNAMAPWSFGEGTLFLPKGQGLESYHLQIFDRWGNLLWETTALDPETASPVEGWDGKVDGEYVPIGSYVWRIDAKFANGKIWRGNLYNEELKTNTGTITIVR